MSDKAVEIRISGLTFYVWETQGYARVDVPSKSDPTTSYSVLIAGKTVMCHCKSFTYRSYCHHSDRIKELGFEYPVNGEQFSLMGGVDLADVPVDHGQS